MTDFLLTPQRKPDDAEAALRRCGPRRSPSSSGGAALAQLWNRDKVAP